jgi:hypothetical protein
VAATAVATAAAWHELLAKRFSQRCLTVAANCCCCYRHVPRTVFTNPIESTTNGNGQLLATVFQLSNPPPGTSEVPYIAFALHAWCGGQFKAAAVVPTTESYEPFVAPAFSPDSSLLAIAGYFLDLNSTTDKEYNYISIYSLTYGSSSTASSDSYCDSKGNAVRVSPRLVCNFIFPNDLLATDYRGDVTGEHGGRRPGVLGQQLWCVAGSNTLPVHHLLL